MLSASNIDVLGTLRRFKAIGLPASFLVPTPNGMRKSIMDATFDVREFLLEHGVHDYFVQQQGPEHKVRVPTKLVSEGRVDSTYTSLYRPYTKKGDPRIWIGGLNKLAGPTDLLAILVTGKTLVIINCSRSNLDEVLSSTSKIFQDILSFGVVGPSPIALDLISKMEHIYRLGHVSTKRSGDTGVGFTLEDLLGIKANSSKAPDFNGIEIKAKRWRKVKQNRTTIFSQVPNWGLSRLKSSKEILYERGKFNTGKQRVQLFHSLSALKPNSYSMQLQVDVASDQLNQIYLRTKPLVKDVVWEMSLLKDRLSQKHKETFWVSAETIGRNGSIDESFWYTQVKHTSSVDESAFPMLLELGVITLDYTIKEKAPQVAKDQGYLFKINERDLDLLFRRVDLYDLSQGF